MRAIALDLLKRCVGLCLVLLGVLTIIFSVPYLAPGGPERALIGWPFTAERATSLRMHYAFDRPLHEQYSMWFSNWLAGEWGRSKFTGRPVIQEVEYTLPLTLKLLAEIALLTILLGSLFALAAIYPWHRSYMGRGQELGALAAGFPDFFFAILLKFFFVWHLEWFPIGGFAFFAERPWQAYRQLFLPALSVSILYAVIIGPRVATRLAMLAEPLDESRCEVAYPAHSSVWRLFVRAIGHSTIVLLQSGSLLFGSAMLAEKIFTIPGFGDFGIEAFVRHDYPKIQAFLLVIVGSYAVLRTVVNGIEAMRKRRRRRQRPAVLDDSPPKAIAGFGGLMMQDGFFLGAVLVVTLIASTIFAAYIAPALPDEVHMKDRLQPPTTQYWMGSDLLGRDILSRVIYGGRHALTVAGTSAAGALLLGYLLGAVPRLARRPGVMLMTPLIQILEAFPPLILGLLLMTILGQGHWQESVALATALAPAIAATLLYHKSACRRRFFLPVGLLTTLGLQALSLAIVFEATLNFLDIGLLPLIPSWGGDLKANLPYLHVNPSIVLFPGMAVVVSALGFNLMAQSVRKQTLTQSSL